MNILDVSDFAQCEWSGNPNATDDVNSILANMFATSKVISKKNGNDLMAGAAHYISKFKPRKDESNLYSGELLFQDVLAASDPTWFKGLYFYLNIANRSRVLPGTLTSPVSLNYNPFVPIFLMAHKKYNDIPYSAWNRKSLAKIVPKQLLEIMLWTKDKTQEICSSRMSSHDGETSSYDSNDAPETVFNEQPRSDAFGSVFGYNKDILIKYRNIVSQVKGPLKTFKATKYVRDVVFDEVFPNYLKVLALQLWCAHPSIRHKYMILNPADWDNIPEPLLDGELIEETSDNLFGTSANSKQGNLFGL